MSTPPRRGSQRSTPSTPNGEESQRSLRASSRSQRGKSQTPARSSPREGSQQTVRTSPREGSQQSVRSSPRRGSMRSSPRSSQPYAVRFSGTPNDRSEPSFVVEPSDMGSNTEGPANTLYRGLGSTRVSSPLNYGYPSSFASSRTPKTVNKPRVVLAERNPRTLAITPSVDPATTPGDQSAPPPPTLVVWGTDVTIATCKAKFKIFIESFVGRSIDEVADGEGAETSKIYYEYLNKIEELEDPYMNLNCAHLQQYDDELYKQLVNYPQEVIPAMDLTVNEMFFSMHPDAVLHQQIQIRPFNVEMTKNMRNLNPEDIDRLITINGLVIRTSYIIPDMREAFFECGLCEYTTTVEVDRGRIAEPTLCMNCNSNFSFGLVHNRSSFTDKQSIKLQEAPDEMPAGHTPHTVTLFTHNELVDKVQPGQKVWVTGIYRAVPLQVNPKMRNVKSVYRTHIDVLHFTNVDAKKLFEQKESSEKIRVFQPARIEMLKKLSQRSDVYERLAHSIAPSIFENEDIKKGILLLLFGGTRKEHVTAGRSSFRSELNILLCGDPGTSKSQLLTYVYNLVPKSQYTSGKGSSAVGLTAYVTKDPDTRQLVLQTGALVMADNGVCCIDEFDKMNDATRSVLHEVMEQQTLSIAKAGIICQLSARASVLAAANPCGSQWDKNQTIIDNIRLPHTLLSRFDLIFLMLDPQSTLYDRKLAKHLVSLYHKAEEITDQEFLDTGVLRDYITYARENIKPRLTDAASNLLVNSYVEMRKIGSRKGQISAYPRQLESLIRLAEAHAKMRMSEEVEVSDVEEAKRLHREALKQSATDPLSGKIDVSILTTGLSMAARKKRLEVSSVVNEYLKNKPPGSTVTYQKLFKDLRDSAPTMITKDMLDDALKDAKDEGLISMTHKFTIRIN